MSYPGYPSGPGGGGYPPYPNPSNAMNYGFVPEFGSSSPYQPQPQPQIYPPPSGSLSYPEGNISSYPTASWGSAGSIPYPPQPHHITGGYSPYQSTQSGLPSGYPTGQVPLGYPTGQVSPAGYPTGQVLAGGYSTGQVPTASYPTGQVPPPTLYPALGSFPSNPQQQVASVPPSYPRRTPSPTYGSYGNSTSQYSEAYPTNTSSPNVVQQQKMANYGTVKEHQPFQPDQDSQVLRKAMKGFGTDEKAIVDVLAKRTNGQRLQIYITYKSHFGRDLIHDLKSELTGHFEDIIVALMTPIPNFLASQLHWAIAGLGTDESTIIEILCSRTNQEVREINAVYQKIYGKSLEKHLMDDTSGHFRKLLVSLGMANREESTYVDQGRAAQDAQRLYQAGQAQWGTDESVFNSILVTQSYAQLKAVFAEYQRQTGKSITHSIKTEFSGDVEKGLLTIAKCVENTPSYFAERLYNAMAGAGTDDGTLIRIIATRCEVDMILIKQEFQRMFGKTLESFISGDTSGDYKRILLALVQ